MDKQLYKPEASYTTHTGADHLMKDIEISKNANKPEQTQPSSCEDVLKIRSGLKAGSGPSYAPDGKVLSVATDSSYTAHAGADIPDKNKLITPQDHMMVVKSFP